VVIVQEGAAMSKTIVFYLISHASGELVEMLARNAVTQLEGVEVKRRLWKMVRRLDQVPEILGVLATAPGYVLHSISHSDVRAAIEEGCRRLAMPYQFALEPCSASLPSTLAPPSRLTPVPATLSTRITSAASRP
jgi:regulator of PEP synthase PpsR (kinase-PPPase family)